MVVGDKTKLVNSLYSSIKLICKSCQDDCSVCPLRELRDTAETRLNWSSTQMCEAIFLWCHNRCGDAYPLCANMGGQGNACIMYRPKQIALFVKTDKTLPLRCKPAIAGENIHA